MTTLTLREHGGCHVGELHVTPSVLVAVTISTTVVTVYLRPSGPSRLVACEEHVYASHMEAVATALNLLPIEASGSWIEAAPRPQRNL